MGCNFLENRMKYLFALLFLSVVLFAGQENAPREEKGTGPRPEKIDSVVATVNGEPITLLDVLLESGRDEARLAAMFTGERLYEEIAKLRKNIANEIIVRKLVYEKYKEKPFEIRQQHVEDMVDLLALSMGDGTRKGLEKKALSMGTTMDALREKAKEKIAVDVMLMEHCDRRATVTPKAVYEAYQSDPKRWTNPRRIGLQLLLIRRESRPGMPAPKTICDNLVKTLKGAKEPEFTRLVRENSEGPNVSSGGKMGLIEMDGLRPEFSAALKNAAVNDVIGPVETPEGYYIIRVDSKLPETKLPFEKASPEIEQALRKKAVDGLRARYTDKLKREAVIRTFF